MERFLSGQQAAFAAERYPTLQVRRDRLDRIAKLIEKHGQAFCEAISRDFGQRSPHETSLLELAPIMAALRHTRSHLRRWMRPERRGSSLEFLQMKNRVEYQPLGVVGILVPWNYPLMLTFGPLIDVLAAGNRAMIKPSELLPETADLLEQSIAEFFKADEVAVVNGGVDVAEAFSSLPFDHLVFTGSTAVGRKVMAAAARNLTPLTLELGGKSPVVFTPDYPIETAARDIAFGKLMNAGQTCIAPDYVLAPRDRLRDIAEAILSQAKSFYPVGSGQADYTSLVGARNFTRMVDAVEECRVSGCTVLSHESVLAGNGHRVAPTIVLDPPVGCLLMQEEIFGPVLPLVPYDDIDAAIAFINERPRPLALYIFSKQSSLTRKLLAQTHSGNVTINGTLLHIAQNDLPFGGIGPSGIGAYHGKDGFRRFSHARGIAEVRLFNPSRLAMPPYGKLAAWLQRFMMRN
ncbi:coniferyl aldehyde dehydrogenase [Rhizobium sp. ARZ01]|uniref:coniferyl aldehyde dehydrogenase n=1 Tax=Rhizobium sp. ARZ01 TaxID=2769313 RepID=UPI0017800D2F|nr:coniferyl aldehyde dehydrogenase [Rhizobium sp. ARZ01]MBD9375062.1 coniferyl aldehyde dehydrogenase [Rhizobium sp. ARZ01]